MTFALAAVTIVVLIAIVAVIFLTRMPGRSFRGSSPPLSPSQSALRDALRADVVKLAGEIGERNVILSGPYAEAAKWIEQSLAAAGCVTSRQTYIVEGVECANVEGEVRGTSRPDEIVVIGAHYDTVDGSPGADDNASGVAAMLAMARLFARHPQKRTIRFVAFANEEPPYFLGETMGSFVYARRCRERNETMVAMISVESIGVFSDAPGSQQYPAGLEHLYPSEASFIAFASNVKCAPLLRRVVDAFRANATIPSEGGALPEEVPGVAWSDQWSFWRHGYDAVMVTDTAPFRNPHYHTERDTPETIDYERLARVTEGLVDVVRELAG